MNTAEQCPFCGSLKVVPGRVLGEEGYGFQPAEAKQGFVWSMRRPFAFHFGPAAQYCADCNMVWPQADPQDAAKFLDRCCTDDLKRKLAAIGPKAP